MGKKNKESKRAKKDKKVKKTGENSDGKGVYDVYQLEDRLDDKDKVVQIQVPQGGNISLEYALVQQQDAQDRLDEWTDIVTAMEALEPTEE